MNTVNIDNTTQREIERLWKCFHEHGLRDKGYAQRTIASIVNLHGGFDVLVKLSSEAITALRLFCEQGWNEERIGNWMGKTKVSVKKILTHALEQLEGVSQPSFPKRELRIYTHKRITQHLQPPKVDAASQEHSTQEGYMFPNTVQEFWKTYDVEDDWKRRTIMICAYCARHDIDKCDELTDAEREVLRAICSGKLSELSKSANTLRIQRRSAIAKLRGSDLRLVVTRVQRRKRPKRETALSEYLADRGNKRKEASAMQAYTPLIYLTIKRLMFPQGLFEEDDLVSMGSMGLLTALRKYDPSRGKEFRNFAISYIKYFLLNETRADLGLANAYNAISALKRKIENQNSQSKELDTDKDLLSPALSEEDIRLRIRRDSLDRIIGYSNAGHSVCVGDLVADPHSTSSAAEIKMQLEIVEANIPYLSQRQQNVLYYIFFEDVTTYRVGIKLGITKNKVMEECEEALSILKHFLSGNKELPRKKDTNHVIIDGVAVPRDVLTLLNEKQRIVYISREEEGLTLEDTGKKIGVTRERVRQIEKEIRKKLPELLNAPP